MAIHKIIFHATSDQHAFALKHRLELSGIKLRSWVGQVQPDHNGTTPTLVQPDSQGLIIEVPDAMAPAARMVLRELLVNNRQGILSVTICGETRETEQITDNWWQHMFSFSPMTAERTATAV